MELLFSDHSASESVYQIAGILRGYTEKFMMGSEIGTHRQISDYHHTMNGIYYFYYFVEFCRKQDIDIKLRND